LRILSIALGMSGVFKSTVKFVDLIPIITSLLTLGSIVLL
jgi:hypothetical protein